MKNAIYALLFTAALAQAGCSPEFWGGTAVGALGERAGLCRGVVAGSKDPAHIEPRTANRDQRTAVVPLFAPSC